MGNPFQKFTKKTTETKSSFFESDVKKTSSVSTRKCDCCGAPRPAKSNLAKCSYCNTPFMNIDAKIEE